ncbi:PEMK-like protein [Bifidobacterium myosotis]|uniref:PEMK-like protein n=2 Tax=Bifidobacterium myosotis TaxID=1630166 RepID=A0A261FMU5_9BIFI|nr:PEMK-like protein [Bifidobacterium myosotis]
MTDKIVTVDRNLLGYRVGVVDGASMDEISRQLAVVLGLS